MKSYIITGLFLLTPLLFHAQNPQWKIYNLSNSNIPWNKIKAMDFDKNGHLWGGYDNSGNSPHLTEFDGDSFYNYLYDAWVNHVVADDDGDIWFTTSKMELYRYNGNFQIYTNSLMNSAWLEPIYVDHGKNVWIINNNEHSITKFNGSSWTQYRPGSSILKNSFMLCMASFQYDLMVGTSDSGLIRLSTLKSMVYDKSNSPLPSNSIYCLKEGKNDTLWLVCSGNLGYFTGNDWYFFPKTGLTSANSIQLDSKGNIWISNPDFSNGGVYMFDRKNWTVFNKTNSPLPTNQLLDLKIDQKDNIWIATWGSGLVKLTPYTSSLKETHPFEISYYLINNHLIINLPEIDLYQIQMTDISGKQVFEQKSFFGNNFSMDISTLPHGIYIVSLKNDQAIATCKIIKS